VSAPAVPFGLQTIVPVVAHTPWPREQVPPRPGKPSSVFASQSSLVPLQISVCGPTAPVHGPNPLPPEQTCTPIWQKPWHVPVWRSQPLANG